MKKAKRRSPCPVACTLDIVGDKWTLLVIRDLLLGRTHHKEFLRSPEGIATNILSDRLKKLLQHKLVETFPSPTKSGKTAYRLTEKGQSLGQLVGLIADWGDKHLSGTERRLKPINAPQDQTHPN